MLKKLQKLSMILFSGVIIIAVSHAIANNDKILDAEKAISKAYALMQEGNWHSSLKACDEALEIDSKNITALYYKIIGFNNLNMHQEAIETCNKAIKINPNYAKIYSNKAVALYKLGRYEEALESYQEGITPVMTPKK